MRGTARVISANVRAIIIQAQAIVRIIIRTIRPRSVTTLIRAVRAVLRAATRVIHVAPKVVRQAVRPMRVNAVISAAPIGCLMQAVRKDAQVTKCVIHALQVIVRVALIHPTTVRQVIHVPLLEVIRVIPPAIRLLR